MDRPPAHRDLERGSTLVDVLVAFSVLGIVVFFASDLLLGQMDVQSKILTAEQYSEYEHAVRHGAGKFAQAFQHSFTTSNPAAQCNGARAHFNRHASNFAGGRIRFTRAPTPAVMQSVLGSKWREGVGSAYEEAIERCARNSFTGAGSLSGKSSFYFCSLITTPSRQAAFAQQAAVTGRPDPDRIVAFAEFRVNFWDFNRSVPLNCEALAGIPGRGSIINYTLYLISRTKDQGQKYAARRHSGRFYAPRD